MTATSTTQPQHPQVAQQPPHQDRQGSPPLSVQKTVTVEVPQAHAFAVFTERQGTWWPLATHHIAKVAAETAVVEPRAGGRWFERGVDGSECEWGRVLAWEPPHRLVLAWQLTADWRYDPDFLTKVEVRFVAVGPRTTRVELEHRHLERYGEKAESFVAGVASDGGWPSILRAFAATAESTAPAA